MENVKNNSLIDEIAKMLDSEGAFAEFFNLADPEAKPMPPTPRQKYFQARYRHLAVQILNRVLNLSHEKIREELIAFEKKLWKELGLDLNKPAIKDLAENMIEDKYGSESFQLNLKGEDTPHRGHWTDKAGVQTLKGEQR